MMLPRAGWLVALVMLTGMSAVAAAMDSLHVGRFGKVRLVAPAGDAHEVVLFFSGARGWDAASADMASRLAADGAWVAGIDTRHLLAELEKSPDKCVSLPVETENLSHYVQARLGLPHYHQPTLAGSAEGAALAYATLVASPANLFKGALSADFCPQLPLQKPLCKGQGLRSEPGHLAPGKPGVAFLPTDKLGGRWVALPGEAPRCSEEAVREFVARVPGAQWEGSAAAISPAFRRIVAARPSTVAAGPAPELRDLPLTEVAAGKGVYTNWFAVFLSGDGGWVGLDRGVAEEIAKRGIPVVGWDSLRYFWTPRTPQGAAADLDRVLQHYAKAWGKRRALLLGYSQGADTLPFMANRLPATSHRLVGFTALVAVSNPAYFEFQPSHWLGKPAGGLPILPEFDDWGARPYVCLYGAQEDDSLCPQLSATGHALPMPGGHHFGGSFAEVADQVLRRLPAY